MATTTRDAANALPDELLLDIFARLQDPLDLLRCAGTCQSWLRLLAAADAAFLRQAGVLPENRNASLLLGAFYQNHYLPGSASVSNISDCPPRFWRLADLARSGFRLFSKHGGLFNYAKPLASRHGLLLTRLMPSPIDYRKLQLAVYHPLLGGVHHVPPPPVVLNPLTLGRDVTGYALVTGYGGEGLDSQHQRQLVFRVLFTAVRFDRVVCVYSYSSATGNWRAPTMCPLQLRDLAMSGPRAGLVDGHGTTHWLYRDDTSFYTLDVSADAERVSLSKIPILVEDHLERRVMELQPPFPCITQGGKFSLVFVGQPYFSKLKFWTKGDRDDNNQGWIHYELPMYHMPDEPSISLPPGSFKVIGFTERRGALLIKCYFGLLFFIDLESGVLEMIKESKYSMYPREDSHSSICQGYNNYTQCPYNNYVLYEMDWSSYLLHLSAWSPRSAATW